MISLPNGPLRDERVQTVIDRLERNRRRAANGGPRGPRADPSGGRDPHAYADFGFPIHATQGELLYLLCRATGATRVVEFATSFGFSTLYLAAAMRDNGGGLVIGSELVSRKIDTALANLAEAGLSAFVEIRPGDARESLRDLGGAVDLALIDGWPGEAPTASRSVIEIVAPQLRIGAIVMNDNGEDDYLAFVRGSENGFRSTTLTIAGGTELSVKVA